MVEAPPAVGATTPPSLYVRIVSFSITIIRCLWLVAMMTKSAFPLLSFSVPTFLSHIPLSWSLFYRRRYFYCIVASLVHFRMPPMTRSAHSEEAQLINLVRRIGPPLHLEPRTR